MKEFLNITRLSSLWVKDNHFWKGFWIHTNFFKITNFLTLRRTFWLCSDSHYLSLIQSIATWNADNHQSYNPKTSVEGTVCSAEYSCSFSMIISVTVSESRSVNEETVRSYGHICPWGSTNHQMLWGMWHHGSLTLEDLLWDSRPDPGSWWTRRPPALPGQDSRGILGLVLL